MKIIHMSGVIFQHYDRKADKYYLVLRLGDNENPDSPYDQKVFYGDNPPDIKNANSHDIANYFNGGNWDEVEHDGDYVHVVKYIGNTICKDCWSITDVADHLAMEENNGLIPSTYNVYEYIEEHDLNNRVVIVEGVAYWKD